MPLVTLENKQKIIDFHQNGTTLSDFSKDLNIPKTTCTLKLARAKLPANAGKFASGPHVKRPHTNFTCLTCSLPVKARKFICCTRQASHTEYT